MLGFTQNLFDSLRSDFQSFENEITSHKDCLQQAKERNTSDQLKLKEAFATITQKELKLIENESDFQNLKQKYFKLEADKNHLKTDFDKRVSEYHQQLVHESNVVYKQKQEIDDLQRKLKGLVSENTDLNQMNEHRRKTIEKIEESRSLSLNIELMSMKAEKEGLNNKLAELSNWLTEREQEIEHAKASHQKEIEEFNSLIARYQDRIAELENEQLKGNDVNQSLDIKTSMHALSRNHGNDISEIQLKNNQNSFDMKAPHFDYEITILEGMDNNNNRKPEIDYESELKKNQLLMETVKNECQETISQNIRKHNLEVHQLKSEKQALLNKMNELIAQNMNSEQKNKSLENEIMNFNFKIQKLNEQIFSEENSNKFLKYENQKLHDELSKNTPLPTKTSTYNPFSRPEWILTKTINYFKYFKKYDKESNYNFSTNKMTNQNEQQPIDKKSSKVESKVINVQTEFEDSRQKLGFGKNQQNFKRADNNSIPNASNFDTGSNFVLASNQTKNLESPSSSPYVQPLSQKQPSSLAENLTDNNVKNFIDQSSGIKSLKELSDSKTSLQDRRKSEFVPSLTMDQNNIRNRQPSFQEKFDINPQKMTSLSNVYPELGKISPNEQKKSQTDIHTSNAFKNINPFAPKTSSNNMETNTLNENTLKLSNQNQTNILDSRGNGVMYQGSQTKMTESILLTPHISTPIKPINGTSESQSFPIISDQDFAIFIEKRRPSNQNLNQDVELNKKQNDPIIPSGDDFSKKRLSMTNAPEFFSKLTDNQKVMLQSLTAQKDSTKQLPKFTNNDVSLFKIDEKNTNNYQIIPNQGFAQKSDLKKESLRIFDDPSSRPIKQSISSSIFKDIHLIGQQQNEITPNIQKKDSLFPNAVFPSNQTQINQKALSDRIGQMPNNKNLINFQPNNPSNQILSSNQNQQKLIKGKNIDFSDNIMSKIKLIKPKNNEKSTLSNNKYSYNHLNMEIRTESDQYVLRDCFAKQTNSSCFSDIVNRMNKWQKKTEKFMVIKSDNIFVFNQDRTLKKRFPIRIKNIKQIDINIDSNFFCISDFYNRYEVFESIRKEELINFIFKVGDSMGHSIKINKVSKLCFENSEQKQIFFNPTDIKKYKPHWIPTFNYAQKKACLSYAKRDPSDVGFLESIWDPKDKCILILTNLAIIILSTIEFNVKDVIPLVRVKIFERDRDIVITMCDETKRVLSFFSELDKNIWANSIKATMKALEK